MIFLAIWKKEGNSKRTGPFFLLLSISSLYPLHIPVKYKEIDKVIKRKCHEGKSTFFDKNCQSIRNERSKAPRDIYRLIREACGKSKSVTGGRALEDRNGAILFDENEIMKRWEEYASELHDDPNWGIKSIAFDSELTGLFMRSNYAK